MAQLMGMDGLRHTSRHLLVDEEFQGLEIDMSEPCMPQPCWFLQPSQEAHWTCYLQINVVQTVWRAFNFHQKTPGIFYEHIKFIFIHDNFVPCLSELTKAHQVAS